MKTPEAFDRQLSDWGLRVGSEAKTLLLAYARMLSRYDKANVVGTRNFDEILRRHVLDSLSCLLFPSLREVGRLADVGSGGGLPGIPLAVMLPDAEVTLFESTGKKAAFLRHASGELGLRNVSIANGRVEEAAREGEHRGVYNACTVRAVARLSVVAEYCLPLLRKGGHVVAMKGRKDGEEWDEGKRAATVLGGRDNGEILVHHLPEIEQRERRLVLLQKVAETPDVYPRRTGTPVRAPLGTR